jgi:hypothetical protein
VELFDSLVELERYRRHLCIVNMHLLSVRNQNCATVQYVRAKAQVKHTACICTIFSWQKACCLQVGSVDLSVTGTGANISNACARFRCSNQYCLEI